MIKTILIDDEPDARAALRSLLGRLPDAPAVVGEADTIERALDLIGTEQPDLIFLDVQLEAERTGFDLLARLPDLTAEVIFVTAYNEYAVRAFQMAAFGYLLKPVQLDELKEVVERFRQQHHLRTGDAPRTQVLLDNRRDGAVQKLVVSNVNGFRVLTLDEIVYLRGEVNYTRFFLESGEKIMVSKTLRDYEKILTDFGYFRVHQSYLINLRHVVEYRRGEGGTVVLSNGNEVDVSRRRKKDFVASFLG